LEIEDMPELLPFRWPASWADAALLDLLKGTPVNCLAGEAPPPVPLGGLPFVQLDEARPPEGIALRQGVWPGVAAATKEGAVAGATGGAWVDSNAWVVRLAQVMEPGRVVWLTHTPPGGKEVVPLDSFVKPILEAEAFGAHWVMALDEFFAGELARRSGKALAQWRRMMDAARFAEARRGRRSWEPLASVAVVSTFEGDDKLLSEEFLNLAPRRHLAFRVVRAADAAGASFARQKAVLYLENTPPQGALRAKLLEFAQAGGLLIAPRGTVDSPPERRLAEHTVRSFGKGRVAMPLQKWEDPFLLPDQVHVLVGHREDPLQVWNTASMDTFSVASPKDDQAAVHLIPYASGPTLPITLSFRRTYRRARVVTLDGESPAQAARGRLGTELAVRPFTDYAVVELEA
jgi:hypothetical protein